MVLRVGAETHVWQAADLQVLSGLTALEELDMGRLVLEDKPLTCSALGALPALQRLDLVGTNLTDECLPVLQRMAAPLTYLQLNSNFRLTGEPASSQHWGVLCILALSYQLCDFAHHFLLSIQVQLQSRAQIGLLCACREHALLEGAVDQVHSPQQ